MNTIECRVEAVCVSIPGVRVAKAPRDEVMITENGFEGDRHARPGMTLPDGRIYMNPRQWSAVCVEEVAEVCAEMGCEAFAPGALGENLLLSGIHLAAVPPGSILELPSGARLGVADQNVPCGNAAMELSMTYGPAVGLMFVNFSWGRRGVIGPVLTPGMVRVGDVVRVLIPEPEVVRE